MFLNREDAARQLAAKLKGRPLHKPLVLAIPRGGVVTGAVLAQELGAELDVVLSRKLRAPEQPELAIGAIAEDGQVYFNHHAEGLLDMLGDYLVEERRYQLGEIARRRELFRAVRPQARVTGRSVIVTDDGIATGSTMIAALQSVKAQKPRELIVAAPVASPDRLAEVAHWCDDVVCLLAPESFWAVGQFYEDFSTVEDEEVVRVLRDFAPATGARAPRRCKRGHADMIAKRWEHFAHDADIGVRGIGASKEEAFEQAALGLIAVITNQQALQGHELVEFRCEAPDDELLLVDWLNALVYEIATRELLFGRFEVHLDGHRLHARAWGEKIDVARHQPAVEVKGATLTCLRVSQEASGDWVVQCVVDV